MKYIAIILIILISAAACADSEPPAEPIPATHTVEPTRISLPENTPIPEATATSIPPTATATAEPPVLSPQTFFWYTEDETEGNGSYLVKMTAEGQELWRRQFDQLSSISVDTNDGGVWTIAGTTEFESSLVKLGAAGQIIQQISGYSGQVVMDPHVGSLWVNPLDEPVVIRLNTTGEEILRLNLPRPPYAMVIDPLDNGLWLGMSETGKVMKLGQHTIWFDIQNTFDFRKDSHQAIAIDPNDGTVWRGSDQGYLYKLSRYGDVEQVIRIDESEVMAVDPNDSSLWVKGESGSTDILAKLDRNGIELFRTLLDFEPTTLAVHPEDGSVWVGNWAGLIKLSAELSVQTVLSTINRPRHVVAATVLAAPPSPIPPNTIVVTTATGGISVPIPMPPTPTPTPIPAADICAPIPEMHPGDCQALVQMLNQTIPHFKETLMSEGCNWQSVICDQNGRLTRIWLSNVNLNTLPPEIAALNELQKLELPNNNLTTLPSEIGQLANLQELHLGGNPLKTLPPEIGQLTNLQLLTLSAVNLQTLPPEIGNLTNLQRLTLMDVNFLQSLLPGIGSLTNLQQLDISKAVLEALPPEIGSLTNLQHLHITHSALETLPPEISNLTNLTSLNLAGNNLQTLPPEIERLANLTYLGLNGNRLNNLPPEIGNLANLQGLSLGDNSLVTLPPEIGNLSSLESLDLQHNYLSTVPPEIGNLANLIWLNLAYNYLNTVPPEIGNLTNLFQLFLNGNSLESLPPEIGNLADLGNFCVDSSVTLPPPVADLKERTMCYG